MATSATAIAQTLGGFGRVRGGIVNGARFLTVPELRGVDHSGQHQQVAFAASKQANLANLGELNCTDPATRKLQLLSNGSHE